MPNALLDSYLSRYEAARAAVEAINARVAARPEGERDLTPDETTEVEAHVRTTVELAPRIEAEVANEARHRSVADAAAAVAASAAAAGTGAGGAAGGERVRGENAAGERYTGSTHAQDRDPGHYRSAVDGGEHSFFGDLYRASRQLDDGESQTRLTEHSRALSTGPGNAGQGLVPPNWLVSEYELKARFGRALAGAVRYIPIVNPAPMTLPGQTTGTDAVVAEQAVEGDAVASTDAYGSTTVTVTPKPTAGAQIFTRQMLDMANPAIDLLIYGDLLSVYDDKIEKKVCDTVLAAAGAAVTTFATGAAFLGTAPATPGLDALIDAAIAVRNARKLPANAHVMGVSRFGSLKKMKDTTGRPLLPNTQHGPMNVAGLGDVMTDGEHEGIPLIVSDGISTGTFPEDIATLRLQDTILFEGSMMRFRFEEVQGPEAIRLGIWAYTACVVRQATSSVRRTRITAA
jgi:HK97 family phage major capsid protein